MTRKRERKSGKRSSSRPEAPTAERRGNSAVVRFILIFVLVSAAGIGLEYYLMAGDLAQGYRAFVATVGNWLPARLGIDSSADDTRIFVGAKVLEVTPECSGIEAMGIFCAGVLAFPCGRRSTLAGLLLGFVGVGLLNILRVAGLTAVADWKPDWFGPTHDALTHLFPLFAVLPLWLVWLLFVVRKGVTDGDHSARGDGKPGDETDKAMPLERA